MRLGGIGVAFDERMRTKHLLDACPLDSHAAAVDQAYHSEPGSVRGGEIFLDDRRDVTRGEGVKVQLPLDRDLVRGLVVRLPTHTWP